MPVGGFTTEEIRERGHRVGFVVEAVSGEREVLAHVDRRAPPRVGKYGVDLDALERVAIPALGGRPAVLVIDELGKMELASEAFRGTVERALEGDAHVVATVHAHRHPFTDGLKRRLEMIRVTRSNRDGLPEDLAGRLRAPGGRPKR